MKKLSTMFNKYIDQRIALYISKNIQDNKKNFINEFILSQYLVFGDERRLTIASTAIVNNALFNLSSGNIIIEDFVFFGHNVSLLTGTHDYNKFGRERQLSMELSGRDILIHQGVWIASNATIIGPCEIGEHAVIGACSLITENVDPYTVVSGIPGKQLKTIAKS